MTLTTYSQDCGPHRWRVLYAGPSRSIDGPTLAICLRRMPTLADAADAPTIPAATVADLYRAALVRHDAFERAWSEHSRALMAGRTSVAPEPAPLPEWPEPSHA